MIKVELELTRPRGVCCKCDRAEEFLIGMRETVAPYCSRCAFALMNDRRETEMSILEWEVRQNEVR